MVKVTKFEISSIVIVCFLLDALFDVAPGSSSAIGGIVLSSIFVMGFGAIIQKSNGNSNLWWLCYLFAGAGWSLAHYFIR